jgi:HPt (histidine-containing phosphotransfer) domain-containing protein
MPETGPEQALDRDALENLRESVEPDDFARLIDQFAGETRKRLLHIAEALRLKDLEALEEEAHTLKGSAATFGAAELRERAAAIEQACLDGDGPRAIDLARSLATIAEVALGALAEHGRKTP